MLPLSPVEEAFTEGSGGPSPVFTPGLPTNATLIVEMDEAQDGDAGERPQVVWPSIHSPGRLHDGRSTTYAGSFF